MGRCVILRFMANEDLSQGNDPRPPDDDWLAQALNRGWAPSLHLLLDVVEPVGPLVAQVAWVLQPASMIFGAGEIVRGLANALETPEGIAAIRQRLAEEETP